MYATRILQLLTFVKNYVIVAKYIDKQNFLLAQRAKTGLPKLIGEMAISKPQNRKVGDAPPQAGQKMSNPVAETAETAVEETATTVEESAEVPAPPAGGESPKPDTDTLLLQMMEESTGLKSRVETLEEIVGAIGETQAENPTETRMMAIYELKLRAAGMRLGKEYGEKINIINTRVSSAQERAAAAEIKAAEAEKRAEAAEAKAAEVDRVLAVATEALEQAGMIAEAVAEMRQIGEFCDSVKTQVETTQQNITAMIEATSTTPPPPATLAEKTPPWMR